jgi:hypothetical protein
LEQKGAGSVKPKGMLVAAVVFAIVCLFQIVSLVRYLERLPGDRLGIGMHIVTIILFAVAAIIFYIRWRREEPKA